jgi:hypothetical protein
LFKEDKLLFKAGKLFFYTTKYKENEGSFIIISIACDIDIA